MKNLDVLWVELDFTTMKYNPFSSCDILILAFEPVLILALKITCPTELIISACKFSFSKLLAATVIHSFAGLG